jgi:hypothetical protein
LPVLEKKMLAPEKKGLAPELFLVLSTPKYNHYHSTVLAD